MLYDSQSREVSFRFYQEIRDLAQKLSYVATAYNDGRFHIYTVKNGHSVKFIVRDGRVYISAFLAKGREFVI
nr:type II toxin-antitoxin system RelE/ParE family toxin [Aggregatibacter actinomycetemcomitans]